MRDFNFLIQVLFVASLIWGVLLLITLTMYWRSMRGAQPQRDATMTRHQSHGPSSAVYFMVGILILGGLGINVLTDNIKQSQKHYLSVINAVLNEQVKLKEVTDADAEQLKAKLIEIKPTFERGTITIISGSFDKTGEDVAIPNAGLVDFLEIISSNGELSSREVSEWLRVYDYSRHANVAVLSSRLTKAMHNLTMPFNEAMQQRVLYSYKSIHKKYIPFAPSPQAVPKEEAAYLAKLFYWIDIAGAQRAYTYKWLFSRGKKGESFQQYQAAIAKVIVGIRSLTPPPRLAAYQDNVLKAIDIEVQYLSLWADAMQQGNGDKYNVYNGKPRHALARENFDILYGMYKDFKKLYPKLSKKNIKSIENRLCNLALY